MHLLFWLLLIASFSFFYGIEPSGNTILVLAADHTLSLPVYLFATYISAYCLIPVFLLKKKFLLFILTQIPFLYLCGLAELCKTAWLSMPLLFPEQDHSVNTSFFSLSQAAFYVFLPMIIFVTAKYLLEWYQTSVRSTELEKRHIRNELKILKSQLHPGFLISSLSSLTDIARKDPRTAASGIEKISEILSFMLYEFNHPLIPLEHEIRLLRNYISLQEMNLVHVKPAEFTIIGELNGPQIPPFLLFSGTELFYRCLEGRNTESLLNFFCELREHELFFRIECKDCDLDLDTLKREAIYLNLSKRLEYLFPGQYELNVRKDENAVSWIMILALYGSAEVPMLQPIPETDKEIINKFSHKTNRILK
jgi:hypothetical protein